MGSLKGILQYFAPVEIRNAIHMKISSRSSGGRTKAARIAFGF